MPQFPRPRYALSVPHRNCRQIVAFRSAKVRLVNALLRSKRRHSTLSEGLAQPQKDSRHGIQLVSGSVYHRGQMRTIIVSDCDQCNFWFWIGFPLSSQNTSSLSLKDKDQKKEQAPSMDERVRSLRIAKEDRLDQQRSNGWFPWLIAIVFA